MNALGCNVPLRSSHAVHHNKAHIFDVLLQHGPQKTRLKAIGCSPRRLSAWITSSTVGVVQGSRPGNRRCRERYISAMESQHSELGVQIHKNLGVAAVRPSKLAHIMHPGVLQPGQEQPTSPSGLRCSQQETWKPLHFRLLHPQPTLELNLELSSLSLVHTCQYGAVNTCSLSRTSCDTTLI
jgi:hypothetical protein